MRPNYANEQDVATTKLCNTLNRGQTLPWISLVFCLPYYVRTVNKARMIIYYIRRLVRIPI